MNGSCELGSMPSNLTDMERQRAAYANTVYCEACAENGIRICSWETSSAWQEYVEGAIGESELIERAKNHLKSLAETFQKYTVVHEDESAAGKEREEPIPERARHAGKLYKKACADSGMNNCFFNNFSKWSDYVHGRINDDEFSDEVAEEAKKMAQAPPESDS